MRLRVLALFSEPLFKDSQPHPLRKNQGFESCTFSKPEAEAKLVKPTACRGFKPDGLFK